MERYLLMILLVVFLIVFLMWYSLTYCDSTDGLEPDDGDVGNSDIDQDTNGGGQGETPDVGLGDGGDVDVNVSTGKIKVDIVDLDEESLVGDTLDYVTSNGAESVLFEPGAAYCTEGFKVKNTGTNPLNFTITVSGYKGEQKELFDNAFELYITTDPSGEGEQQKLTSFSGSLNAGESSETYYLVVRMKENAGNEYQGKIYTGIGITVHATQANINVEE